MAPLTRSVIETSIRLAKDVCDYYQVRLPHWAYWTCKNWDEAGDAYAEVRDCMLGWDVTDFGSGDFANLGRTLFTLRNGRHGDPRYPKPYAEKLLLDPEDQRAPAHFHRSKREDIVCRFGGNMLVQLTSVDDLDQPGDEPVTVAIDGCRRTIASGDIVRLEPGMSVTIAPRTLHQFWAEAGSGLLIDGTRYTLTSEISSVCDDWHDNHFLGPFERFPKIVEDAPRHVYLCHEYPPVRQPAAR